MDFQAAGPDDGTLPRVSTVENRIDQILKTNRGLLTRIVIVKPSFQANWNASTSLMVGNRVNELT